MSAGRLACEAIGVTFACALFLWPFRLYGFDLIDEGTQLVQIERAAGGEQPYVDFDTGYTPGYFALGGWLLRVGGGGIVALRTFGLLLQSAMVGGLWAIVRAWSGARLAVAVVALYVAFCLPVSLRTGAPFNTPYPGWLAASAALSVQVLVARVAARRIRNRVLTCVACGALAGLAFSFKPNAGLLVLAGGALALAPSWSPDRRSDRALALLLRVGAVSATAILLWPALGEGYLVPLLLPVALAAARARPAFADGDAAVGQLASMAAGFAAVVLPWLAPLFGELGLSGVLREVLLLGGGVVDAYLLPFPAPGAATVVLALGATAATVTSRRPDLLPWIGGTTVLVAAVAGLPAGARPSAENALLWLAPIVAWFGLWDREALARAPRERATFLFLSIYSLELFPRPDTMHVAMGGPVLALAGALLWRRYQRRWREATPQGASLRRVPAIALAAALALALGRMLPTFVPRLLEPTVPLALGPRAPVQILDRHAEDYRWITAALEEIGRRTAPGEPIFAFPDVAGLGFLAGRPQPFYDLYFVPGRPDREGEARTLDRLEEVSPGLVVDCPPHVEAFAGAPRYFARLGERLARAYSPAVTVGGCTIRVPRAG